MEYVVEGKEVVVNRDIATKCEIHKYNDSSAWSVTAFYGEQGVLVATYICGKLEIFSPRLKNGRESVKNRELIKEFKKYVKVKFKELDKIWLDKHNELYGLKVQ